MTCAGLALPFDAAIALPTSELNAFSRPARNSATIAGLAARTSSTMLLDRAVVGDLRQAFALDNRVRIAVSHDPHRVEDLLRDLAGDRVVATRVAERQAAAAQPGARSISISSLLSAAETSPCTQFATSFAGAAGSAATARSKYAASCAASGERRRVVGGQSVLRLEPTLHRLGQLRQAPPSRARSTPARSRAAAGRDRGSSDSPARLPCCASTASRRGQDRRAAFPARRCRRPRSARSAGAPRTRWLRA